MATKTLVGTSLSTWAAANFVGGTAPVANDDIVIPPSCTVSLAGSTLDLSAGDSSDVGVDTLGLDLGDMSIQIGSQINIGTAAAPLKCIFKNTVHHQGSGSFCYGASVVDPAIGDPYYTTLMMIDSPNSSDALKLSGAATINEVQLISGGCHHTGAPVTLLIIAPKGIARTSWSIATGTVSPTTVYMTGGELSVYEGNGVVYMSGGILTMNFLAGKAGPTVFMSGGLLRCNSGEGAASQGPPITATGGIIDFTPLPGVVLPYASTVGIFKRKRNVTLIGEYRLATTGGVETIIGED